jgi:hypothetical protein
MRRRGGRGRGRRRRAATCEEPLLFVPTVLHGSWGSRLHVIAVRGWYSRELQGLRPAVGKGPVRVALVRVWAAITRLIDVTECKRAQRDCA